MKRTLLLSTAVALALIAVTLSCTAQPRGGGPSGLMGGSAAPKFGGAFTKVFGDFNAFTARVDMDVQSAKGKKPTTMGMNLALLDGKVRAEIDTTSIQSPDVQPGATAQLKALGMDRLSSITRPDKKQTLLVFPGLQSYVEMPLNEADAAAGDGKDCQVENSGSTKETVAGRACVKSKAVVTCPNAKPQEFLIWKAAELKNFPVQVQMTSEGSTFTLRFSDVKFDPPAASLFDAPAGYKKYSSPEQMMMENMQRLMGAQPGK